MSDAARILLVELSRHTPWVLDKVSGGVVSMAVRGIWDRLRACLSPEEVSRIESSPASDSLKALKRSLERIAAKNPALIQELAGLAQGAVVRQNARGNGITQVAVSGSTDVRLKVK